MEDIIKDIERRKKILEKDKRELAEAIGQEKQLMTQLKEEFELEDLESAEKYYKRLTESNEEIEKELREDYERIKEQFPW